MNRPLSSLEKVFWLLDRAVSQNFVMVARLSKSINEPVLETALDILQEKHPPLYCHFEDGDVQKFVGGSPKIPLKIIEKKGDKHWIEISEKEMVKQFPWTEGPLVRVVMLNSKEGCDLLITFCHIIADALSGVKFVQSLLQVIDKLTRGESAAVEQPLPELPSTFDLIKDKYKNTPDPGGDEANNQLEAVNLDCEQEAPLQDRITRVIHKQLLPGDAKKLVKLCRQEKTTIHGALCAALMQSTVYHIKKERGIEKKGPLFIGCTTPVSIRELLVTPIGEDIGNFISDGIHFQEIDESSSLWTAARNVKTALQEEIKYDRDIKAIMNIGDLLNTVSTPMDVLNAVDGGLPPVLVTNLGQLDISETYGDFKLTAIHFTASFNPAAKVGLAVSSFNGTLTVNFQYLFPHVSENTMTGIVENTMKRLTDALS